MRSVGLKTLRNKLSEYVRLAEAEIDLRRVRDARHQLLNRAWRDPGYESDARLREKDALVWRCARVDGPVTPMPYPVVAFLESKPEGPLKLAMILAERGPSMARHGPLRTARALAAQVCDPSLRYKLQNIVGAI